MQYYRKSDDLYLTHFTNSLGKTQGAMDAAQLLKPLLARGVLRLIGATTLDEYRKHIEKDAAMERRFQQVYVSQPTVEATISILRGIAPKYEAHHGVRISDRALVAAAQMSDRYITQVGLCVCMCMCVCVCVCVCVLL